MKKNILLVALLAVTLTLSLVACGEVETEGEPKQEVKVDGTEKVEKSAFAKPGVWIGKAGESYSDYLYINQDGESGSITSLQSATGFGLKYAVGEDGKISFTFAADDTEPEVATLTKVDENKFTLTWEDGSVDEYTFVQEGELFEFYSNDELCEMALEHYKRHNEGEGPALAGAMTNQDLTVTIQLYDNLGDHNSTADYYTVDRITAKGISESTMEEIDLNN